MNFKIKDEEVLLLFLKHKYSKFSFFKDGFSFWEKGVITEYPTTHPYKVMLAKLKKLCKRGLIKGCGCGCRGDWYLTEKGLEVASSYSNLKP